MRFWNGSSGWLAWEAVKRKGGAGECAGRQEDSDFRVGEEREREE